MSRHVIVDGNIEVTYGYDYPLSEYFCEKRDLSVDSGECDEDNIIEQASSYGFCAFDNVQHSNSEMWAIMKKMGVPEKHLSRVAMDLPIP